MTLPFILDQLCVGRFKKSAASETEKQQPKINYNKETLKQKLTKEYRRYGLLTTFIGH